MRKLIFNLHLCVALVAGAFVVILGATGSIMAFETEITELAHASRVFVTPGEKTMSLAQLSAVALKVCPGKVRGFHLATRPNRSFGVVVGHNTVFINPYTGSVLGVQTGPDPVADILGNIHQFHLRLLINNKANTGKEIIRWSGVGMALLALSGLYLWWPQKRIRVQRNRRSAWTSRSFWFDLHNAVGIFSTLFLLLLAITGVAIGFENHTLSLFARLTKSPPVYPPQIQVTPPEGAIPISPDKAVEIARAALPGASPFDLSIPGPEGAYWIRARYPEDRTPGGRSYLLVDQYSGKVLFAQGSRTAPASVRLLTLNRALHTGDLLGLPSKILMSAASLAGIFQMVSGMVMFWKRLKKPAQPKPADQINRNDIELLT